MQAFHNDPKIKAFYVSRLQELQCLNSLIDPISYPKTLGLPTWYAHLCDVIFEGLPADKRPAFALASLTAIEVGVDIEVVRWKLAVLRHQRDLDRLVDNKEAEECRQAIQGVVEYCQAMVDGSFKDEEEAEEQREKVRLKAEKEMGSHDWESWWSVAESESRLASRSAWWSADSAPWSTSGSAWWSADSAATRRSEARADHFIWEADSLIRLLVECK